MNVLLVCSSGVTTNILATKLQKYSAEQSKPDYFNATRVGQFHEMLPHADVILVAPQASLLAEQLKNAAREQDIPCWVLDEPTFVLGDVEKIYAWLDSYRISPKLKPKPELVELSLPLLGKILLDAALYSVPILLCGLFFRLLGMLLSSVTLQDGSNAVLSLLVLYLMFSIGYQYGAHTHCSPVTRGLIAMGAPLLMLPMEGLTETWNTVFRVSHGYIPLTFFTFPNALLLTALALTAVLFLSYLDRLRLPAPISVVPIMESAVKMGAITVLFLLLRAALLFL